MRAYGPQVSVRFANSTASPAITASNVAAVREAESQAFQAPDFLRPLPNPAGDPFVGEDEGGRWVAGGEVDSWEHTLADLASGRGAALKRHAFLLCGNEAQAEDLVQEALVRAFTRPLRVSRPGAAEAYVRVIMVNLFIDGARRRARWSRVEPLLRPAEMAPDPADQVSD